MDLIQDLSDFVAFATKHPEPLTVILFDVTKTERAKQISLDLIDLMNQVNRVKISAQIDQKKKCAQLVGEIRAYGKYTLWNSFTKE